MGGLKFPSKMLTQFTDMGYPSRTKAVDCKTSATYNELTFVFGGVDFTIRSENWIFVEEPKKKKSLLQASHLHLHEEFDGSGP